MSPNAAGALQVLLEQGLDDVKIMKTACGPFRVRWGAYQEDGPTVEEAVWTLMGKYLSDSDGKLERANEAARMALHLVERIKAAMGRTP